MGLLGSRPEDVSDCPHQSIGNRKLRTPENPESGKKGKEPQRLPKFGHVFGLVGSSRQPGDFCPLGNDPYGDQYAKVHAQDAAAAPNDRLVPLKVFPPGFPGRHVALFGGVEDAADFGEGNLSSGDCAGNGPHYAAHAIAFVAHPAHCKYITQAPRSGIGSKSPQEEPVRTFRDHAKLEEPGEYFPPRSPGHEDEIESQQEKERSTGR